MAEIPPKTNGRKASAATCALALVPGRPGTELMPLELDTNHIRPKKKLHTNVPKIQRIDNIFGRVTIYIYLVALLQAEQGSSP